MSIEWGVVGSLCERCNLFRNNILFEWLYRGLPLLIWCFLGSSKKKKQEDSNLVPLFPLFPLLISLTSPWFAPSMQALLHSRFGHYLPCQDEIDPLQVYFSVSLSIGKSWSGSQIKWNNPVHYCVPFCKTWSPDQDLPFSFPTDCQCDQFH